MGVRDYVRWLKLTLEGKYQAVNKTSFVNQSFENAWKKS
jgi:hypothetical protein